MNDSERALNYATQPTRQGEGDDAERMARRMAAVDELRQEFRKVHPGIFPETRQH